MLVAANRAQDAETSYQKVLQQLDWPDVVNGLARAFREAGQTREGIAVLDSAMKKAPNPAGFKEPLASLCRAEGNKLYVDKDYAGALPLFRRVIDLTDDKKILADAATHAAYILAFQTKPAANDEGALCSPRQRRPIRKVSGPGAFRRWLPGRRIGNTEGGETAARQALRLSATGTNYGLLQEILVGRGRCSGPLAMLQNAAASNAGNSDLQLRLANAYLAVCTIRSPR